MFIFGMLQLVLLVLLSLATVYIFVFAAAGLFYKQKKYPVPPVNQQIAVLIPGYKEDEVIVAVAKAALQQTYPSHYFDVIVIADSFLPATVSQLKALPVQVIEVQFESSTKAKALNKAMSLLTKPYDVAVVLDADNIMAPDFLEKINAAYAQGYMAIQGHRTAKNINTSWAILDAVSEEINNHIFRKGHRVLGLSSAIIGSGMAFQYDYFKQLMAEATAVGGFDKEIELNMLREKHVIEYVDDAIVYDEKVQKAEVFGNQRRRWLSAQVHYFKKDIGRALHHLLFKGNVDYFDKAIQFIQPPRILLLGAVLLCAVIFIPANLLLHGNAGYVQAWMIVAAACILSFLFSVPGKFYNAQTLHALVTLPKGMLVMLLSLLRIKGANKKFIHTKHTASTP